MTTLADRPLGPSSPTDTTPEWKGLRQPRRSRLERRVLLAAFATLLVLGLSGVLGVRTGHTSAVAGDWALLVDYPAVTRPGLAVPWRVTVRHTGGFGKAPILVRTTADYFDLFDENSLKPDADGATIDDGFIEWEFTPPPGDEFVLMLDTRTGPNRQRGAGATTSVVVDGQPVVSVSYHTRVVP